jgi:hypothetical protein
MFWRVRGRVVNDFKPFGPHRCGLESRQGLWIHSGEGAISLAYRTSVDLLRCPYVPKIIYGRASDAFLQRHHMTSTMLV